MCRSLRKAQQSFFFCLVFRQLRFSSKIWTTLDQTFSAEKQDPEVRPRDGLMEHVYVFKLSGSISQNGRNILDFCAQK